LAEVKSVDERLGYILKAIKHQNLLRNTYIIFTSDHGEQFGEHNKYGHGAWGRDCNYYNTLLRIPLIIMGPGISKGKRIKTPISHLDLLPTIKSLLGISTQKKADGEGESYKSLLMGGSYQEKDLYFIGARNSEHKDALLRGTYKLITTDKDEKLLFNISVDPQETMNIDQKYPDIVKTLLQTIKERRNKNAFLKDNRYVKKVNNLSQEDREKAIEQLKSLGYMH